MKRNNFSQLIKEEMVNRFEAVISNEIAEYKNSRNELIGKLDKLEKEVKGLKDDINYAITKCDDNSKEVIVNFYREKELLKEEFEEQRRYIRENIKETRSFISDAKNKIDGMASQEEVNANISKLYHEIQQMKIDAHEESKRLLVHLEDAFSILHERFGKEIQLICNKFGNIEESLKEYRLKLSEFYVLNESYLKELNEQKKKTFIQEKKIENLYTLIQRIEKRMKS